MEKFLRILLCASAALLSLVACDQEQIGEMASPNDSDNKEIHFVQKSLVKEFEQGTKEGEFTVVLARNGNKGTYRVLLQKSGKNASLFSVRDTVVIPDGQYSVEPREPGAAVGSAPRAAPCHPRAHVRGPRGAALGAAVAVVLADLAA